MAAGMFSKKPMKGDYFSRYCIFERESKQKGYDNLSLYPSTNYSSYVFNSLVCATWYIYKKYYRKIDGSVKAMNMMKKMGFKEGQPLGIQPEHPHQNKPLVNVSIPSPPPPASNKFNFPNEHFLSTVQKTLEDVQEESTDTSMKST